MASSRRTKNFANDPQTPMFLYTILKQLDLRSINWNDVADGLSISNGHAARMRYSRMKSQFEGLSSQPKPQKPKKANAGEAKTKSKAKNNKRLLMEDEADRIAGDRASFPTAVLDESGHKRVKMEPQPYMNPWHPNGIYTGYMAQPYVNAHWPQPTTNSDPRASGIEQIPPQSFLSKPTIKKEPDVVEASSNNVQISTPLIKEEPDVSMENCNLTDPDVIVVKREPGVAPPPQSNPINAYASNATSSHPLSQTTNMHFDRQPITSTAIYHQPSFLHPMAIYNTTPTYVQSSYPSMPVSSGEQASSTWPRGFANVNDEGANNLMLNPCAATYQDMLRMPLHQRHLSIVQIPHPNGHPMTSPTKETEPMLQEQDYSKEGQYLKAGYQEQDTAPILNPRASTVTPMASPDSAVNSETALAKLSDGPSVAGITNVVEVESDSDVEDAPAVKIKTEIVEL